MSFPKGDGEHEPDFDLDPTRPHVSARLGRYELRHRVGYGGMAEVFLAVETGAAGLDRWVAIKRIHPGLARQRRFVEMLLDEARIAARISHPNVAQVLDLGEADGVPYIVMEYLHGQPLSAIIARAIEGGATPDVDLMARIVAHAAEGAHAAHELRDRGGRPLGIVHRDLSPHNVFVTYDGAVKVVDFGIAKAKGRATMTEPGTLKGKFSYMSPEQARGAPLDRRSDVYALGLVLYEATTGACVYEGQDHAVLAQVQLSQIEPPSRGRKGFPVALDAVVGRALAREAADRFATARDLGQELDRFLVSRRAMTGPAEIATMMLRLFPEPSRSRVGMPAGATPPGTGSAGAEPAADRTKDAPPARAPRSVGRLGLLVALIGGALGVLLWVATDRSAAPASEPLAVAPQATSPSVAPEGRISPLSPPRGEGRGEGSAEPPPPPEPARVEAPPLEPARVEAPPLEPARVEAPPLEPARVEAPPLEPAGVEAPPLEPVAPPHEPARGRISPLSPPRGEGRGEGSGRTAPAPAEPVGTGTLDVRSEPWAYVSVDGQRQQPTPVVGLPLPAGPHALRLVTEDGRTKRVRVVVTPGRPARVDVRF